MPGPRIRRLIARKPSPALARELARLISRLLAHDPDSPVANVARRKAEHLFMQLLARGGLRAVARVVGALPRKDYVLLPSLATAHSRAWQATLPGERELTLQTSANRLFRTASVRYRMVPKSAMSRQRRVHKALQEEFYFRYLEAGKVAYAPVPGRLRAAERLIMLVGELEADVNNGGFLQYLDNKGRRRAAAALAALTRIEATGTAALLRQALGRDVTEAQLSRLDHSFDAMREDLAVLAIRAVGSRVDRHPRPGAQEAGHP
jgi:Domain of unknown function (DUF4375)